MSTIPNTNIYNYATRIYDLSDNLITPEKDRYLDISNSYVTHARTKDLQRSHNKRAAAWRWIYIVVLAIVIISVMLILLRRQFDSSIIDWAMVLIIAAGLIYLLVLYLDIQSRSPIDYDKINPDYGTLKTVDEEDGKGVYGINDDTGELCRGRDCCQSDHTWNDELQRCQVETFQVMGPRGPVENYNENEVYTKYA